ncbi:ATP-binding protein [Trinickia dinghuensis]|uniref:histidine kinase n=1 Tax=Trinickia dinghuensis TaxID=2291023 RepID=A0A3D8JPM4_9BURK|nr:ATP-binding protein [Trinickia dinghuensis]RDU94967.1 HAMP domain-containing protein [Trinickia dinghuensis]
MRSPLSRLAPPSVRAKLVATFLLLFAITLAVVIVGVQGMHANQNALDEYEANVVPEIARALELSDKVAQLAAVAPSATMTAAPDLLRSDTDLLRGLLADIRRLAPGQRGKSNAGLEVLDDLDAIDEDLPRLLVVSDRQRQLADELTNLRNAVDRIGDGIARRKRIVAQGAPTLIEVWARTAGALQAADSAELGSAESDNEALWLQVHARGEDKREPELAAALARLDGGERSVFDVRREFLASEAQTNYLVTLLRGHADHLSGKSARYVERLQQIARERSEKVRRVALSSQSGLLLLAFAGVAVALAGVAYVNRILRKLQAMTRVMGRLASGDTSGQIPSTHRPDEIGELARAFEVFRTNLLENARLTEGLEAQRRLREKMDVLGQLTGGVAHDFNNFLVAILGNLELLIPRVADRCEELAMAERARRAAERASRLTRRLLAFARRQPLQAERIAVDAMLAEMLDLVEYSAGLRTEVVLEPSAQPRWVEVDRGQLENAILNLTLNSVAAMPDGGKLTLSVRHDAPLPAMTAPRSVVLSVADTGSGIAPLLLDKVVEPFFTTKAAGEGSGLGLSSVYGFVRQSGGDLRIQSAVGRGTTVELWLPATEAEPARPAQANGAVLADGGAAHAIALSATPVLGGASVLVVEDDPEVRDTTLTQFATLGARAHAVTSVADALAWLDAHGLVTLVLSDISLGASGSGIDLAAQVAKRWPTQRIALTSGLPPEVHQSHPDWQPELPFVPKPFDLAALAALLH